jgi:hypothetical protein
VLELFLGAVVYWLIVRVPNDKSMDSSEPQTKGSNVSGSGAIGDALQDVRIPGCCGDLDPQR